LIKAAELVNSSGGEWGYVTVVIQKNDRDKKKWQAVFDQMRQLKLIPIIRIATQPQGAVWEEPSVDDIGGWIDFFEDLNWVVKDRYIVLFNEPNHAAEWGGKIDPEGYAKIAYEYSRRLKEKSEDYFVMLAGFDASAPSSLPNYEDEAIYLRKLITARPELFSEELLSGWSSHSYPNPGFLGGPFDRGRGTVSTYDWELTYLNQLGIQNTLPVFITETGWPHSDNSSLTNRTFPSSNIVGDRIKSAYESIWLNDSRVRAVTPFILNYQSDPFLGFSWKKQNSPDFYDQFEITKNMAKIKGEPEQIIKASIGHTFPKKILVNSSYRFKVRIKNSGQSILDNLDGYRLELQHKDKAIEKYFFLNLDNINPGYESEIDLYLKTGNDEINENINVVLFKKDKKIAEKKWSVSLLPLPKLNFKLNLFPKLNNSISGIEIQFFDDKEKLVYKKTGLTAVKGKGEIKDIKNIYLNGRYRVVILAPYYLPRQEHVIFDNQEEDIKFNFLIPLDFDKDGHFDLQDIWALIKKPGLFSLFKI
ncbi:MAG: hypothetical protein WEC80_00875, partial [Patescibacteria group bacterium]